jgi:2-keto-4-pentenoate hydratase
MRPPLAPLVWPATMLAERGKALTAGMTVSTGSLSPPQPRSAAETVNLAIGGLGEAPVIVRSAYTGAGLRGTLDRGRGL